MTRTSLLFSIESSDERVSSPLAPGLWSMLDAVLRSMVRRTSSALNRANDAQKRPAVPLRRDHDGSSSELPSVNLTLALG